ncbi:MAG: DUF481 domain-containing protein [Verrucomicrobiota bacterium]
MINKSSLTCTALLTLLFALPISADPLTETQLLQQIAELKQKNEALREGFRNQNVKIKEMQEEIARLKQPPAPQTPASATPDLKPKSERIWETEIALGANLSRGNNDSHRVKGEVKSKRTTEVDRLILALAAEAGENEGTSTSEYLEGQADYRRDIHERLYWYTLLNGRRDAIADLDYRFTLSPGLGYTFIDEEQLDLSFEAGPAYVIEKLEDQDPEHSFRGRVGQELEWQINEWAKLFQNSEFLVNAEDTDDWILEAELGIETAITESFSLRFGAKDIYDNQPAAGRKKNDIQLNTAVVYKFQ